jgi:phosphoribosylaminoimidazolecarboxamide formyltransferase/IMP cyclohydrolase
MNEDKRLVKIRRALISVSNKNNLTYLAKGLEKFGVEIISTGGTEAYLKKSGIKTTSITDFTNSPEILGGRVKTLHPKVFGAILAKRDDDKHKKEIALHNLKPLDMVVVNLYPFEETIKKKDVSPDEIIEQIDIGGVTLLRAAAKNYLWVTVLSDPDSYERIIQEMEENEGGLSLSTRMSLALEAFKHTASYDRIISNHFDKETKKEDEFPLFFNSSYQKVRTLRYGENPHQKAAFYKDLNFTGPSIASSEILSGKELSFNNINDLDATLGMIQDFEKPFTAVIKHTNPCGAACGDTLAQAYENALASDPLSAFGCIIGLNRVVDLETAKKIHDTFFVECVIAPGYEPDAFQLLQKKKNRRFLSCPELLDSKKSNHYDLKAIKGGLLIQTSDQHQIKESDLKVVTQAQPSSEQVQSLLFAWKIVKWIKSNAIVLVQGEKTVGIGAGQMSRVDSVIIAKRKAGQRSDGSILASDAFFPMRDGVDEAVKAGVKAIIQPGGSKGDPEVIKACDEHNIPMVFTGIRHFRH